MRKFVIGLIALLLMLIICGMLVVTCAMFDSGRHFVVQPYFFQPNNASEYRPGVPMALSEIGDRYVRDMLIRRFVTEYFYVTPDSENIRTRIDGENRKKSTMEMISVPGVFNQWRDGEARTILSLAEKNAMRSVRVIGEILYTTDTETDGGYWVVEYELQTWLHPNKLAESPIITRGKMYLGVRYLPGTWDDEIVQDRLKKQYDPITFFRFRVTDVKNYLE
ncbi:MAG: hypothetical protein IJ560_00930 [Alphaproteobacteria bacterium]|nr:hypothetical protein [Alphaproteobacteria bacterium]